MTQEEKEVAFIQKKFLKYSSIKPTEGNYRKRGKVKRCKTCQVEKPAMEFYHKSHFCNECEASKDIEHHPHYRAADNLNKLSEEVRWKGAVIVKGYKFRGTTPEPKDISYYIQ